MCNVSTTDEVTAGALPASVLELLDASVPPERAEAALAPGVFVAPQPRKRQLPGKRRALKA